MGPRTQIGAATLVIIGFLFLFGYYSYPVPLSDAECFLPPAILLKAQHTLDVTPLCDAVGVGSGKYTQYPPLFELALKWLMLEPNPQSAFISIAVINCLTVLLCALFFGGLSKKRNNNISRFDVWLIILSLGGIATPLAYHTSGRPEALGTLVVISAMVCTSLAKPGWRWVVLGTALGIMGCTHPAGSLLFALAIAMFYFVNAALTRALTALLKTAALSLLVFLGLMLLSPNGLMETIRGIAMHASSLASRQVSGSLWDYWILNPNATFYGIIFCVSVIGAVYVAFAHRTRIQSLAPALLTAILLTAATYYFVFRLPPSVYNATMFAPLFFWANLHSARYLIGKYRESRFRIRAIRSAFLLAAGLAAIGFVRVAVLFPYFLTEGVSLETARERFRELNLGAYDRVGVTFSMWVLTENYSDLFEVDGEPPIVVADHDAPIIIQENYLASAVAPHVQGYRITHDFFNPKVPTLLGIRLATTMPGYSYAVYMPGSEKPK